MEKNKININYLTDLIKNMNNDVYKYNELQTVIKERGVWVIKKFGKELKDIRIKNMKGYEGYPAVQILAAITQFYPKVQKKIMKTFKKDLLTIKSDEGITLAHTLAMYGNCKMQKTLIEIFGKDIATIADNNGITLAHNLARHGKGEVPLIILDMFNYEIGTIKDNHGWTLAHSLLLNNSSPDEVFERVMKLFGNKIETIKDDMNITLAHMIVRYGPDEMRKEAIGMFGKRIATIVDNNGITLAHLSVRFGNDEIYKIVINALEDKIGTIRYYQNDSILIFYGILKQGGKGNYDNGQTLAHKIARYGNDEIQNMVLDILRKGTATITDYNGHSVADTLARHGDYWMHKRLLKLFGKDIETIKDKYGWTLAHTLARYGNTEIQNIVLDMLGDKILTIKSYNPLRRILKAHRKYPDTHFILNNAIYNEVNDEISDIGLEKAWDSIGQRIKIKSFSVADILKQWGNLQIKGRVNEIIRNYKENQNKNLRGG